MKKRMNKNNITLIGMPGAGKSTVGIILAKNISYGFIDTDVLIQINRQKSLQQILNDTGYLNLRKVEEEEILKLNIEGHIISTGGSAVYSKKVMEHLKNISTIVFLKVSLYEVKRRIHNFDSRGIAKAENQTFEELYYERQILYNRYSDIIVECSDIGQEETAEKIVEELKLLGS